MTKGLSLSPAPFGLGLLHLWSIGGSDSSLAPRQSRGAPLRREALA